MSWWRGVICAACLCAGMARGGRWSSGATIWCSIMACGACHSPAELSASNRIHQGAGRRQARPQRTDNPNLGGAIAAWSDAAIRSDHGHSPDRRIGRPMPIALSGLNQDLAAIAFLRRYRRSRATPGPPIPRPPPARHQTPVGHVAEIPRGQTAAYGAYLAGPVMACLGASTPHAAGADGAAICSPARSAAGGARFDGPWGVAMAGI